MTHEDGLEDAAWGNSCALVKAELGWAELEAGLVRIMWWCGGWAGLEAALGWKLGSSLD